MQSNSNTDDKKLDVLATWRSLNLRISKEPDNLKLHVQRILFGLDNEVSDYVTGALQDLFICLKNKGLLLRQRMFSLLSPIMLQSDRVYFQKWLADNSDKNLKCYRYPGAVFKSETCRPVEGMEDGFALGNHQFGSVPVFNGQYKDALYNLESGQIIKAKAMLENICLKNDEDSSAIKELQSLYTLTRDKPGVDGFTQRYVEGNNVLSDTWSDLLKASKLW